MTSRLNCLWKNFNKLLIFIGILLFSFSVFAVTGQTTYQAKIIKPDGYPLEAAGVNFRFTILDPAGSCVLYVEDYAAVNMLGTAGVISFSLGTGVRTYPVSSTAFAWVFDNSTSSFPCQSSASYNPVSTDSRKIVMQFQDISGWQTLPAMAINAVPYAMYAGKSENAIQLNGKADTAFVEKTNLPTCTSDKMLYFNGVSFSCVTYSASSSGVSGITVSGSVLSAGGTASAPVISISAVTLTQDGYLTSLDYAEFKAKLSTSSTQIASALGYAPVSGAAVTAQIEAAATTSATADTLVKRDSSGNSFFVGLSAATASLNYVDIYRPSSNFNVRLQASTSLSANYTLNLPTTSGTVGQFLSTDGAGNLSWVNPSTGSVISVSGTANEISSTGGANPSLGLVNTGTPGTYFKVITDNKGRVTSGVTTLTLSDLPSTVLNATSNFSGDISGLISNLTVNRIQGVSVTVSALTTNDILQYDGAKYINKNIPTCSGSQYLTFNGISFSCVADSVASGTITTISVTGPISSTGGANPTLSIAQANSTTNGYLSAVDFNTFLNKQVATSAAIIATLGYTPTSASALGGGTNNTMQSGFPDAIHCDTSSGQRTLYLANFDLTLGVNSYYNYVEPWGSLGWVQFYSSNGNLKLYDTANYSSVGACTSISNLYSVGRAFNFAKGPAAQWLSGASGTAYYNAGNVGIGTVSPTEKLEVNGKIKATELCIGVDCRSTWPTGTASGSEVSFRGYLSGATISAGETTTSGYAAQYNQGSAFNAAAGTFTAPSSGRYSFQGLVHAVLSTAGAANYYTSLYVNGVLVSYGSRFSPDTTNPMSVIADTLNLTAGDVVTLRVTSSYSASSVVAQFSGFLITGGGSALVSNAVQSSHIQNGTITGADIASSTISYGNLNFASTNGIIMPPLAADPGTPSSGQMYFNTTSNLMKIFNGTSWLEVGSSGGTLKAALIKKSTAQNIINSTTILVTAFDAAVSYDTGSFFSAGAPDRFTVPVGVTHVRVSASMYWANNTGGIRYLSIYKNGAPIYPSGSHNPVVAVAHPGTDPSGRGTLYSPIIEVSAGDYFQVYAHQQSGGALNLEAVTFGIEAVNGTSVATGGSGTANYIPQWTGTSTLGNSPIFVSGTNIGIGTSPSSNVKLDVSGSIRPGSSGISAGAACAAEGAFAYDLTLHAPVFCNTSNVWSVMSGGLGVGQAWMNVTGSRVANDTVYTNSTGKPIQVSVTCNISGGSGSTSSFSVDGVVIETTVLQGAVNNAAAVGKIVPPGSTYSAYCQWGQSAWFELR